MIYKEMDPALILKAIEGYENALAPEEKALEAFYRQFKCIRCGGAMRRENVAGHVFSDPDVLVPRSCLRCLDCQLLFDPHSGLVVEAGATPGSG